MFSLLLNILFCGLNDKSPRHFVAIKGGEYRIGKDELLENPPRSVKLSAFEISQFDVTNEEFTKFVKATRYVTDAERFHNAMVFKPGLPEFRWIRDPSASWHYPNGKSRGGLNGKMRHPVTTISFHDALAYCKWSGYRLPTLDEWEVACRAGTTTTYFFGSDPAKIGEYANVWHGLDHMKADYSDGYMYTSPVGSFKPNPWGLYDMYGNVFQFCTGKLPHDTHPRTVHARGGSWWCSIHSCCFFNSADIGSVNIRASFSNQGFRVVKSGLEPLSKR
jgi:sulfatase modifying factor 1